MTDGFTRLALPGRNVVAFPLDSLLPLYTNTSPSVPSTHSHASPYRHWPSLHSDCMRAGSFSIAAKACSFAVRCLPLGHMLPNSCARRRAKLKIVCFPRGESSDRRSWSCPPFNACAQRKGRRPSRGKKVNRPLIGEKATRICRNCNRLDIDKLVGDLGLVEQMQPRSPIIQKA